MRSRTRRVDLSGNPAFLTDLLVESNAWKQRVVTEFAFEAANHVRVQTSCQIEFPPALIEAYVDPRVNRTANILLPVITKPKDALLNFNLTGPAGSPATLIPRASIAGLEAGYLEELADAGRAGAPRPGRDLLDAICVFTSSTFRRTFLQRRRRGPFSRRSYEEAVRLYLIGGLEFEIGAADVSRWRARTTNARDILSRRLDEPPEIFSSSEELLLAIPLLEPTPSSVIAVDRLVERYVAHIEAADAADDDAYLSVLSEYGRRYELICEVEVPLLEPFRIKIEEDQQLGLGPLGTVTHPLVVGGSKSIHIEARTVDSNVVLGRKVSFEDSHGKDISGLLELIRTTPERLALYTSEQTRPYVAMLTVRLRAAYQLTVAAGLLILISGGAAVVALTLPEDRTFTSGLGLLVVPITVASTFVLTREESPLATRLQRAWRGVLVVVSLALWVIVVVRLTEYEPASRVPASRSAGSPPGMVRKKKGALGGTQRSKRQRAGRGGERSLSKP